MSDINKLAIDVQNELNKLWFNRFPVQPKDKSLIPLTSDNKEKIIKFFVDRFQFVSDLRPKITSFRDETQKDMILMQLLDVTQIKLYKDAEKSGYLKEIEIEIEYLKSKEKEEIVTHDDVTHDDVTHDDVNKEILKLNQKMINKFGEPPETREIIPSLKWLLDVWLFYNDNKPQIKGFDDGLNINISMYVSQRIQHISESINIIYNLSGKEFYEILEKYTKTNEVPNMNRNSDEVICEKSEQLKKDKLLKKFDEIGQQIKENPSMKDDFMNALMNKHKEVNPTKKHCFICGDNEDEIKLIEIPNNKYENKNLCIDCMKLQKKQGTIFSKVKNDKAYIM